MTQTTRSPLTYSQEARATALALAGEITRGRAVSTDDVLDLADYIIGSKPCPMFSIGEPITFDLDLGSVDKDALGLYIGTPTKPAEPEVYTVQDTKAVKSLPIGTVLEYPHLGSDGMAYVKTGQDRWQRLGRDVPLGSGGSGLSDSAMTNSGLMPKFPQVGYIPGGI